VFILISGGLLSIFLGWKFGYYNELSTSYTKTLEMIDLLTNTRDNYRSMQNSVSTIENEWNELYADFKTTLGKIPNKSQYDNVSTSLHSLLVSNGLTIKSYIPSALAIETKTITMPKTNDEVIIEKLPIDIGVKGNFINFGRMLDHLGRLQYRVTISNILMKGREQAQDIQFIAYVYLKSSGDDESVDMTSWQPPEDQANAVDQNTVSNTNNQMGGIATIPWKGEEVIVGIDNPQYTSDGLEIYAIEYSDGRKEFVERANLPPDIFDEPEFSTEDVATIRGKQEVLG
ncbi:uncharacterized protein METZ01_LOCUS324615, partial [marine metagenome]